DGSASYGRSTSASGYGCSAGASGYSSVRAAMEAFNTAAGSSNALASIALTHSEKAARHAKRTADDLAKVSSNIRAGKALYEDAYLLSGVAEIRWLAVVAKELAQWAKITAALYAAVAAGAAASGSGTESGTTTAYADSAPGAYGGDSTSSSYSEGALASIGLGLGISSSSTRALMQALNAAAESSQAVSDRATMYSKKAVSHVETTPNELADISENIRAGKALIEDVHVLGDVARRTQQLAASAGALADVAEDAYDQQAAISAAGFETGSV
ncbi:hypothetical protein JCM1840_004392, partial [Sporobolomyces johnsonii]